MTEHPKSHRTDPGSSRLLQCPLSCCCSPRKRITAALCIEPFGPPPPPFVQPAPLHSSVSAHQLLNQLLPPSMAYDNPHGLIAAAVIVQTLALGMIMSRFASHKLEGLKFHVSDHLIIVAGVLSTALAIEQIYCTQSTWGAPRWSYMTVSHCVRELKCLSATTALQGEDPVVEKKKISADTTARRFEWNLCSASRAATKD